MRLGLPGFAVLSTLAACAPTIGPVSLPVEVLVVLDRNEKMLLVIPVDSANRVDTIPLQQLGNAAPTTLATHGSFAAVAFSDSTTIEIIDLAGERFIRKISLDPLTFANPIAALAFGDDGTGYAAFPTTDRVATFSAFSDGSQLNPNVSGGPQGFAVARGTVFVVAGNRQGCYPVPQNCTTSPSSFLVSASSGYKDSLALSGPGNASAAVFAPDGFLYVLSSGNGGSVFGRLSQFDPVRQVEVNLFGNFGTLPQYIASDGGERIFVASVADGLFVFNTTTRLLERSFLPLLQPRGLATDALGRLYVLEAGGCAAGQQGQIRVFGTDLIEVRHIPTGVCPVAVAVTEIPSDIFHLKN